MNTRMMMIFILGIVIGTLGTLAIVVKELKKIDKRIDKTNEIKNQLIKILKSDIKRMYAKRA